MIGDLETKNQELTDRLKESNDNTDAKFEIVELKQKIDELECEKVKLVASNDLNWHRECQHNYQILVQILTNLLHDSH